MNDAILKTIDELRKRGAIGATFEGGTITSVAFASPLASEPTEDKPATRLERLTKAQHEELAALKARYEMDEELGNT